MLIKVKYNLGGGTLSVKFGIYVLETIILKNGIK
jgi:hypothetical protein